MGHPAGTPELPDQQRLPLTPREIARIAYQQHRASQRELELTEVVALVVARKPQIIAEIGCDAGGTLYCWRQLCDEVYGITLADNGWTTGGQGYALKDHGATVRIGDSHDPASLTWLREQLVGRSLDVLHIDGDHSLAGVRADFDMYSPLVRPGGLVLIHDVLNERDSRVDVPEFWRSLGRGLVVAQPHNPLGMGVIEMEGTAA